VHRQIVVHAHKCHLDVQCKLRIKKTQPKKRRLIDSYFPQPPKQIKETKSSIPCQIKFSLAEILLLKFLHTNKDTFIGIALFQTKFE